MIQSTTGHLHVNYLKENSLLPNTFKPYIYFDFSGFIILKVVYIMNNKQKSNENYSCKYALPS